MRAFCNEALSLKLTEKLYILFLPLKEAIMRWFPQKVGKLCHQERGQKSMITLWENKFLHFYGTTLSYQPVPFMSVYGKVVKTVSMIQVN